jgi:hypothetical protein
MRSWKNKSDGFTMITTLLLLFLLSGLAIGMLMMVSTEAKVGTQDVQNNITFHAAEGAIEKMTSDLSTALQSTLAPTPAQITALATNPGPPIIPGITFPSNGGYQLTPVLSASGSFAPQQGVVSSGTFAGLNASTVSVQLQATAQGPLGDEVSMNRTVEVAFIPVFQFGVFCDGDCAYFSSPDISFAGRVHTNGDLYLGCGGGNTCTFTDKMTAYGNVIRAVLPNGLAASSYNDTGSVKVPGSSGGCSGAQPACTTLPTSGNLWGSVTGAGGDPPASGYNSGPPSWQTISLNSWSSTNKYLGGMLIDGDYGNTTYGTGATLLTLPFVGGTVTSTGPGLNIGPQNFEVIRRPPAGESTTSPLGASRLYNEAAIRILLSDQPEELPGGATDPDNVQLANVLNPHGTGVDYRKGVATAQPNLAALGAGHAYTTYWATASARVPDQSNQTGTSGVYYADWLYGPKSTAGEFSNEFDSVDENPNNLGTSPGYPYLFNANGWSATKAPNTISSPATCSTTTGICPYPYYATPTLNLTTDAGDTQWSLIGGYLRVEMLPAGGGCPGPGAQVNGYCAVTREWLGLGFARGLTPPTSPAVPFAGTSNQVNPDAILLFQQPAMRNTTGWPSPPALDMLGTSPSCVKSGSTYTCTGGKPPEVAYDAFASNPWNGDLANANPSITAFNWYPINFYDAREGEPSDVVQGNNSCTPLGVMNAVELDVGNLALWLAGTIGSTGTLVNSSNQNGYVLYFSDRRGMLPNPNGTQIPGSAGTITGDAGFEDVVNSGSTTRAPDGVLDTIPSGKNVSPEDNNLTGVLDFFGSQNLGLNLSYVPEPSLTPATAYNAAQSVNTLLNSNPLKPNPYLTSGRISSCSVAQNAWISGARHVLKLVDGGMSAAGASYLPHMPSPATFPNWGGFTVGSENPVYIFGNYNTNASDTFWTTGVDASPYTHSAASIIADTVTVLSNNWVDWNSILSQPTQPQGNRKAATTYYRTAIASGKVQTFPFPSWGNSTTYYTGTDGGVHNFLRFLEDWQTSPTGGQQTLHYGGSMVSLFYSTYATGIMKCCAYSVYQPPIRSYSFDNDLTNPLMLPPGTPTFRDIDNLSYRQSFTPCTVGSNGLCSN